MTDTWTRRGFTRALGGVLLGGIFVPKYERWFQPNRIIVPQATRIAIYWKRATAGADLVPSLAGDHITSRILTFRQGPGVPSFVGVGPKGGFHPDQQVDDVAMLFVESANDPIRLTAPGWTLLQEGPQPVDSPFSEIPALVGRRDVVIGKRAVLKQSLRVA